MTQIVYITRHGNRLDFVDPEWFQTAARPHDPPLSPDGVRQARELARRLTTEGIRHVFSSPFLRAVETADEVARALDLPIKIETGLGEWLNSAWFGAAPRVSSIRELLRRFPRVDASYRQSVVARYPESNEQALGRAAGTAARLVAEFPENMLLVGHGASVLGATAGLLGEPMKDAARLLPPVRCCCLVKLHRSGGRWDLDVAGDVSHLSLTEATVRFDRTHCPEDDG